MDAWKPWQRLEYSRTNMLMRKITEQMTAKNKGNGKMG
jgi:hypothetical protein